ncbi:hypothetical protein PFISCL1PPCAC_20052, partial [Pristionchus fissidentatus]
CRCSLSFFLIYRFLAMAEQSLGLCGPEPVSFEVYVPHGNHPIWTMPNCSEEASACISIYKRRVLDMGVRMTKNYRYKGISTDTPQNWINMTTIIMAVSMVVVVVLIGGASFARLSRELRPRQKKEVLDNQVSEWYQNSSAKSYLLLMGMQLHEKEEQTKKE